MKVISVFCQTANIDSLFVVNSRMVVRSAAVAVSEPSGSGTLALPFRDEPHQTEYRLLPIPSSCPRSDHNSYVRLGFRQRPYPSSVVADDDDALVSSIRAMGDSRGKGGSETNKLPCQQQSVEPPPVWPKSASKQKLGRLRSLCRVDRRHRRWWWLLRSKGTRHKIFLPFVRSNRVFAFLRSKRGTCIKQSFRGQSNLGWRHTNFRARLDNDPSKNGVSIRLEPVPAGVNKSVSTTIPPRSSSLAAASSASKRRRQTVTNRTVANQSKKLFLEPRIQSFRPPEFVSHGLR